MGWGVRLGSFHFRPSGYPFIILRFRKFPVFLCWQNPAALCLSPCIFFFFLDHIFLHGQVFLIINIIPFPLLQIPLVIDKEHFFLLQNIHQHQDFIPAREIFPVGGLHNRGKLHGLSRFPQKPADNLLFREIPLFFPFNMAPEIFIQANAVPLEYPGAALHRPADKRIADFLRNLAFAQKHHRTGFSFLCCGFQICINVIFYVNFMPSPWASHLADIFGEA